MSEYFYLACHETKQCVRIGQGWGSMQGFYYGNKVIMENLKTFLNETYRKPVFLVTSDHDERIYDYQEIGDHDDITDRPSHPADYRSVVDQLNWPHNWYVVEWPPNYGNAPTNTARTNSTGLME